MSEEILDALIQLFGIIAKQDDGVNPMEVEYVESFLTQQLGAEAVQISLEKFKKKAGVIEDAAEEDRPRKKKRRLTAVGDSVRILSLCRKINKKINQKQKVVVLVRLFEMVNTSKQFTEQRMAIINTVGEVFNISKEEFLDIENFVVKDSQEDLDKNSILIIDETETNCNECKSIQTEALDGKIIILRIKETDLYFLRYTGTEDLKLNGLGVHNNRIYLFATGSTIRLKSGKTVYYSDVVSKFLDDVSSIKLSYEVKNLHFRFPTGDIGLRDINFSETHGKLVGIMGASGAGKTTLLNILTGMYTPTSGEVLVNGINLHKDKELMEGVLGYIPQDDLLVEELSVFDNLYFNAKFCFKDKSNDEIKKLVDKTLKSLGLFHIKDLKVGNVFNKLISGGQRKRLNIALELIREPSILYVDEPTSGLSSRDSENVMDLLRELALKGKLIFVVIHQPSSDIYKMFDNMLILDTGGYLVYYGNPVRAISYFKEIDNQVNSNVGECSVCGNVTPELVFNILEAKMVDEFGQYTSKRKVSPKKWEEYHYNNVEEKEIETVKEDPPQNLKIPNWFVQFSIYLKRDVLSKLSNSQYIFLNLTEAPLLGFILAYIIRYIADPKSNKYILYDNENIPPYIFMSIVVALFLGLIVSADEIFKDRKILKREQFLNLSRSSYLASKILILLTISAIQAIEFVIIGNSILVIPNMYFEYWLILFSTFMFANMLGLIISDTFNTAVTIYILIPILIIPQMALGGAMFSFDKLNRNIGSVDKVPVVAEFMASRWAYEALMVYQFKNNEFEKRYFELEKKISQADFKQVHYIKALKDNMTEALDAYDIIEEAKEYGDTINEDSLRNVIGEKIALVRNEIAREMELTPGIRLPNEYLNKLNKDDFDYDVFDEVEIYLAQLNEYYGEQLFQNDTEKQAIISYLSENTNGEYIRTRKKYHNEHLQDIVKNTYERYKILIYKDKIIQQIDPIFKDPDKSNWIGFRSHFYAPKKYFMGMTFPTFWFNLAVIWLMSILLYIPLYFSLLKKILEIIGKLKLGKFFDKAISKIKTLFKKKNKDTNQKKAKDRKTNTSEKKHKAKTKTNRTKSTD